MVVTCEVKFDNNPNAIFFAGQVSSFFYTTVILWSIKSNQIFTDTGWSCGIDDR